MKRPRKEKSENAYLTCTADNLINATRKPKWRGRAKNEHESRSVGGELEMSLFLSFRKILLFQFLRL